MISLLTILLVIGCAVLAFFVLIQQPKGGGLAGNFGSLSTQMMGVKQSSDIMEKGTWATIAVIGLICLFSIRYADSPVTGAESRAEKAKQEQSQKAPAGNNNQPATAPAKPAAPAQ